MVGENKQNQTTTKYSKLQVSEVQYLDTEEGSDKILIENKSILILYFSAFRMLYPSTNHQ